MNSKKIFQTENEKKWDKKDSIKRFDNLPLKFKRLIGELDKQ